MLRIGPICDDTEAEGPGRRWALWVAGCSLRCAGCCNPELLRADAGVEAQVASLCDRLDAAAGIEGISILGGEPFEQAAGVARVAAHARARGLTVMVYSGYTLAELRARPDATELLAQTDLLVDGRYDRTRPEPSPPVGRRWIGSTNQELHFLTAAYRPEDPRFRGNNSIEIHVRDGRIVVNGWPAGAAALLGRSR